MIIKIFKKLSVKNFVVVTILFSVFGCGSGTSEKADQPKDSVHAVAKDTAHKKENMFYSLPSPIQLGQLLKKAGATFDKKVLNALDNVSKYSTSTGQAFNLGVYGADLSYSAIFNETQSTMLYLDNCKKMSEKLGISSAFSKEMIARMDKNKSNKDSLLQVISELFLNSNEALKDNSTSTSVIVLTGGFIEGLYVGTQVAKTVKDKEAIVTRIAELKGALKNLIAMLMVENVADKDVANVLSDLKEIKTVYDKMPAGENKKVTVKSDTTKNKMTIGGKAHYTLTPELLNDITLKVEALRNKIIKL